LKQQTEAPKPKRRPRGRAIPNPLPIDQRSHLRPDEFAKRVGVSRRILDRWMDQGIIPHVKIGGIILIDPAKANAAIDELARKAS
jgi:excisionase family DNA binding protein